VEARNLNSVLTACEGKLLQGSPASLVSGLCTDSRQVQAGELFFAIKGDRFDGHDYLDEVAKKGVGAVVIGHGRRPAMAPDCAVVAVDDTRRALGRLSAAYRRDFVLPVVAVAGSNGKTTTKELIAAVLRQKRATLWSEASFNNDVGVPLTLLRLEKKHEAAVLEVGTNHPGELAPLVRLIQPRYGVITNIGREHLEYFGDVAGVAEEEGWLAELLPADGKLFLNGDSEWTNRIAQRTSATIVRVGFGEGNDWRVRRVRLDRQFDALPAPPPSLGKPNGVAGRGERVTKRLGVTFHVNAPQARFDGEYRINLLGRHQVVNALYALAIGAELGLDRVEIQRGLVECQPAKMRLQLWEVGGVRVLDDAYNANADSMLAALRVLKELPCEGRRVAVLGDMAELGTHAEAAHAEVGRHAAELGVGQLFAVGKMAGTLARGAREAGLTRVIELTDVEAAAAAVKTFLKAGDVVLLKASRATRLERIAEQLKMKNGK
jgi:UDP-N-acetylmuramoyl-tripeptide--D-alanyl-D-alanine ligase